MRRANVLLLLVAAGSVAALGARRSKLGEDGALTLAGTIESRQVRVGSLVGGRIAKVHAEEGARLAAGDPIVTLETDLLDLQLAEQRARIAEAEARLALLEAGPRRESIAAARAEWRQAEADRGRLEQLLADGVIDRSRVEAAQTLATTKLERLRELQGGARREEMDAAEAAVERERAHLAWLERQRSESIVRAPTASRVEALDLRPGDIVAAGQPVASLQEDAELWIRVYVPETELGRVRVGQRASIRVDTWKDRSFEGHVASIRDHAEYLPRNVQTLDQRSDQVFAVRIDIEPSPDLKPGMAAFARIETGGAETRP